MYIFLLFYIFSKWFFSTFVVKWCKIIGFKNIFSMTTSSSSAKVFNVGIVHRVSQENSPILIMAVEAMCELGFQVRILADGEEKTQKQCFDLAERYTDNLEMLENVPKNRSKVVDYSDVLLYLDKPTSKDIDEMVFNGVIPVVPSGTFLANYDAQSETGNAFVYEPAKFWKCIQALIRASENHKFTYDWRNIQKNLKELVS